MSKSSKIVICLISSVLAVFLAIVPLFISNNKVYADESSRIEYYDFQSSNIFIPILNNGTGKNFNFSWSVKNYASSSANLNFFYRPYLFLYFSIDGTNLVFDVEKIVSYKPNEDSQVETETYFYNDCTYTFAIPLSTFEEYNDSLTQKFDIYIQDTELFVSRYPITISLNNADVFLQPVVGVDFSKSTGSNYTRNTLSYFNRNLDRLEFTFYCDLAFSPRTYYFVSDFDIDYDAVYKEGYDAGKIEGEGIGYDKGLDAGLNDFDNNQLNYDRGYAKGLEDSNELSFFSLLSAVVDVPVQTLTGLLDFNFLGFNLLQFFGGILALAVFIMIIRFIIG